MTEVAELPGLLEDLQHCNRQLDVVEKGKRAPTLTRIHDDMLTHQGEQSVTLQFEPTGLRCKSHHMEPEWDGCSVTVPDYQLSPSSITAGRSLFCDKPPLTHLVLASAVHSNHLILQEFMPEKKSSTCCMVRCSEVERLPASDAHQ